MKSFLAIAALALACLTLAPAVASSEWQQQQPRTTAATLFEQWARHQQKQYLPDELAFRYSVFKDNQLFAEEHNARSTSAHSVRLGATRFSDLTSREFERQFLRAPLVTPTSSASSSSSSSSSSYTVTRFNGSAPAQVDWRLKHVVNAVPDQGSCGASPHFSSTGAMESAYAIRTGRLYELSAQQLIDCSSSYGNQGCCGGTFEASFTYAVEKGLCAQSDYPYTATEGGRCQSEACSPLLQPHSFAAVAQGDEEQLMLAVAQQPIAVGVSYWKDMSLYAGGIVQDEQCQPQTGATGMLLVGYGTSSEGRPYWIARWSVGEKWGESGYARIARGAASCQIAKYATYPVFNRD